MCDCWQLRLEVTTARDDTHPIRCHPNKNDDKTICAHFLNMKSESKTFSAEF